MKKAVLAILALGFICNASAYSWYDYFTGSGSFSWAFNSSARDRVTPTRPGWTPPPIPSSPTSCCKANSGFVIR